ncbi:MAG: ATP-binding protein [Bacteroidales bacterium]|jgi:anti-sigma regulatory factor (Ser/Thr protein kinase)|nr:ATP-binding protein [Bacteroidales bacterium]MDD2424686.1 ATP-binding protein [Bacteroidales bacterium]MDD3989866.1 ATP-binding protein [Bacteroidales bacterium]MDD4638442.1 ATP-binding protein [Bacteroidales bacterium]
MLTEYNVEGGDFTRAGYASSQIKKTLKNLNISPEIIKRVVVALYEAEVNIVAHAFKGVISADISNSGIKLVLEDEGPGIPDIDMAMTKGYSTASSRVREMGFGAGMGLPNIKDNADRFNIVSRVGEGTRVTIEIDFAG